MSTLSTLSTLGIDDGTLDAIRSGRAFTSVWLTGYRTGGGTYVIASRAGTTDSGKRRDLLAILPGDLSHGRVLQLYVGVNPYLLAALEEALTS